MKLVVTVPWAERLGGAETFLWTYLQHRDASRVETTVVFLERGPWEQEAAAIDVDVVAFGAGRLRQPKAFGRTVSRLRRMFLDRRPDVILNWSAKTQVYGGLAALGAGMSSRTIWWQQGIPTGEWLDRFATAIPARAIGCYSSGAAGQQQRLWPHRPTFVVHPGIAVAEPAAAHPAAAQAGGVVVGMLGALEPRKGQDAVIESIGRLRSRGLDVRGLFVGGNAYGRTAEYERSVRRRVTQLSLEEVVTFAGHITEPAPYVAAMDVVVNASSSEAFGIALLEAMAQGKPVVAFGAGGPAEIVADGETGFLVAPGDVDGLTEAIGKLAADAGLRRRFGERGRDRLRDRFSIERMVSELDLQLSLVADS